MRAFSSLSVDSFAFSVFIFGPVWDASKLLVREPFCLVCVHRGRNNLAGGDGLAQMLVMNDLTHDGARGVSLELLAETGWSAKTAIERAKDRVKVLLVSRLRERASERVTGQQFLVRG